MSGFREHLRTKRVRLGSRVGNSELETLMFRNTLSFSARQGRRAVFAALMVGLAACGSDSPTAPATQSHGLRLSNNSWRTIDKVYVAACSDDTWGSNKLASPIAPFGMRILPVAEPGCYDVRVVATDGHSWRRDDLNISGTLGVQVN